MPTKLTHKTPNTPEEAAIQAILTAPMETDDDRLALVNMLDDIGSEWLEANDEARQDG